MKAWCCTLAGLLMLSASGEQVMIESHRRNLARALVDDNLIIGVFENTKVSERDKDWYRLRDGTSLREQEHHPSRGQGWYIMRLVQPIKGETDSLVFFKAFPSFGRKDVFLPQPGSRWILILKPVLDDNRRLLTSTTLYSVDDLDKYPVLRPNTLFELYDYAGGALCVRWPEGNDIPSSTPVYPTDLTADIKDIFSIVKGHGVQQNLLQEGAYRTGAAHDVVRELIRLHEPRESDKPPARNGVRP